MSNTRNKSNNGNNSQYGFFAQPNMMNIGGTNVTSNTVGGVNVGGITMGGVKVGNMTVGGLTVGSINVGGRKM